MKKTILFILTLTAAAAAFSQVTTLQMNQREPTYYYWNNHWIENCGITGASFFAAGIDHSIILARYCYTDTSIRVIGVAAPSSKVIPRPESIYNIRYTEDSMRLPEYFQLYKPSDTGMTLLAQARWDTNHPRYRMPMPNIPLAAEFEPIEPEPYVYEAYFKHPVVVRDSFYVAATSYNNDCFFNEALGIYEWGQYYSTTYYFYVADINSCTGDIDKIKLRYTNPMDRVTIDSVNNQGYLMFRQFYELGWFYPERGGMTYEFLCLFPIFDTTGLDIHGFRWLGVCDTVRTLRLLYIEDNKAYISWNATMNAGWWEVAYGEPGVDPNRAARDTSRVSMVCLDNLQPGRQYTVYVRERCKDDTRGPWGEGITITMPESNRIVQPEQSVVDRNTHLLPNPTGGITSVISGFRISTIEVYNTAGALVESININANSGVIDASHLPSGTYILRIRTSHGDTAKKLVRQ